MPISKIKYMAKYGKWIAGGLGWTFFGPIGGILGFTLGSLLDESTVISKSITKTSTTSGDFAVSLVILIAAVMKADGKVLKSELDYVKTFFIKNFGLEATNDLLIVLRDTLKKDIPVYEVAEQIRVNLDYSSRLQLLHLLYGLANADGVIHPEEINILEIIARHLGINHKDKESIKSMFIEDTESSYKILEIDKNATNEELKKAYRRMAVKYHPDKVSYLGEDVQKDANEKFQKVNAAFDKIKKERNMV
jgi:DnaJ like chaperone protein